MSNSEDPKEEQSILEKVKAKATGKKNSKKEKALQEKIDEMTIENGELKDKYLRLMAEFENFRKRNVRESLERMKTASQDIMSALLPVLDDFDRAKKSAEDENTEEVFSEGISLLYQKLNGLVKSKGLEKFDSTGEVFDAELHEAITEIPVTDDAMKGKVVDTIEAGYTLNEKIIRHAKVVVGK